MFRVINKRTGKEPDLWQIARRCKWAKHLVYCDMEGFAVEEDGTLILLDECGNVAYPPNGMFEIIWDAPVVHGKWIQADLDSDFITCSNCKRLGLKHRMAYRKDYAKGMRYCLLCGALMDEVTE